MRQKNFKNKSISIRSKHMTKKVIVVGSGFGGIASALRLKAKGYDVTLIEKHLIWWTS